MKLNIIDGREEKKVVDHINSILLLKAYSKFSITQYQAIYNLHLESTPSLIHNHTDFGHKHQKIDV